MMQLWVILNEDDFHAYLKGKKEFKKKLDECLDKRMVQIIPLHWLQNFKPERTYVQHNK